MTQVAVTILAPFTGGSGNNPLGSLILDAAGDLYGTADLGGNANDGTVFELVKGAISLTVLATFDSTRGTHPLSALTIDSAGDLFGTTSQGGTSKDGTIFELAAGASAITTLANLDGGGHRGQPLRRPHPRTAREASSSPPRSAAPATTARSSIWRRAPPFPPCWRRSTVPADAKRPPALSLGCRRQPVRGHGIRLRPRREGHGVRVGQREPPPSRRSQCSSGANGEAPAGKLTIDAEGNLYGTTSRGGPDDAGTVFELVKGALARSPRSRRSDGLDGSHVSSGLIADAAGNLYGTASQGGTYNDGTVFELVKGASTITALSSFSGVTGIFPKAGLTADAAGNLYGTATSRPGTVFELPASKTPFAATVTTNTADVATVLAAVTARVGSLPGTDILTDAAGPVPGAADPGRSALFVPTDASGVIAVPAGYATVEVAPGSSVSLTGGGAETTVVGDGFDFNGSAATVAIGAGSSRITDNAAGARISLALGGAATVNAAGANAEVHLPGTDTATITVSGMGSHVFAGVASHVALTTLGDRDTLSLASGSAANVFDAGTGGRFDFGTPAAAEASAGAGHRSFALADRTTVTFLTDHASNLVGASGAAF